MASTRRSSTRTGRSTATWGSTSTTPRARHSRRTTRASSRVSAPRRSRGTVASPTARRPGSRRSVRRVIRTPSGRSSSTARCATCAGRIPSQDPSDRRPGTCYLGDPKIANDGPVGLGRFTTAALLALAVELRREPRERRRERGRISCPVLVVNNRADLACTPSHAHRLFDAVASADKRARRDRARRPLLHRAPRSPAEGGRRGRKLARPSRVLSAVITAVRHSVLGSRGVAGWRNLPIARRVRHAGTEENTHAAWSAAAGAS